MVHSLSSLVRYRARVAYDGAGFAGFQIQQRESTSPINSHKNNVQHHDTTRTVQAVLEDVLTQRLGRKEPQQRIRVVAAGRTDAGVHARGQAIHFDVPTNSLSNDTYSTNDFSTLELAEIEISLNKMLTKDVRIYNLQKAPLPKIKDLGDGPRSYVWNSMYESTRKLYCYRLHLGAVLDPLDRHNRWHPDYAAKIEVDQLRHILQHYVGTHDFRAFAGGIDRLEKQSGQSQTLDTVRTVYGADLVDEGNGSYRIDFVIKGALYKQIRNMVGTALDVCQGKLTESQFLNLLSGTKQDSKDSSPSKSRKDNRSKPAPPQGLTLEHVFFDDNDGPPF